VKSNLYSTKTENLKEELSSAGFQPFRASQITNWIYKNFELMPENMKNLPMRLRKFLSNNYDTDVAQIKEIKESNDGTKKILIYLKSSDDIIESVIIPTQRRITFCLSSQVGCPVGCVFCASGQLGLKRNLTSDEIIAQLILTCSAADTKPDNIVFMGIGEPMINIDNVITALSFISDNNYFGMAQRHITISTSGIVKGILKLADFGKQHNLAISLHGPDDFVRAKLIPGNLRESIKDILDACAIYRKKTTRMVTFEYILIKNINDSHLHAEKLADLSLNTHAKVNLIPYNTVDGMNFSAPDKSMVLAFLDILLRKGVQATIREKRGDDSNAACGQLRNKHCVNKEIMSS